MNIEKPLIVMGNGPSLAKVDFDLLSGFDTFGLNAAYRAYRRLDWYPTYFGCFDYIVTESHREEFKNLINEENSIKKFFFIEDISESERVQRIWLLPYGQSGKLPQDIADFYYFNDGGSSGANACQVGICFGYKKIILVGVDCNYKEFIDECEKEGHKLIIKETPEENPNYWFSDYQQAGDEYNIPRGNDFHKPTWQILSNRASERGVDIVNCSEGTKLDCFRKSNLKTELDLV